MAKKVKSAKKDRRPSIKADKFVEVYAAMVAEGKSAKEIGEVLGRSATDVCIRASQLRSRIKTGAAKANLTDEQLQAALAKVPMLGKRGGKNVLQILGIV